MTASLRPTDIVRSPNGRAHRCGDDGIVTGRKGERRAAKLCPNIRLIPVHQPAKPGVEPLGIERLGRRKVVGAAAAPERLQRLMGVAPKRAAHAGNSRRRNGGAKAIEALNAHESTKGDRAGIPGPVKQPEQPERMTDSDGIFWPNICLGCSPGDEAEV